jgi:hypothetical protein
VAGTVGDRLTFTDDNQPYLVIKSERKTKSDLMMLMATNYTCDPLPIRSLFEERRRSGSSALEHQIIGGVTVEPVELSNSALIDHVRESNGST